MRIVNLMEDTKGHNDCAYEHGLCFYIETKQHTILVDTGASNKTWENAALLNIDIKKVDTVILSHGHYDHTGGVLSFIEQNPNVHIYMQKTAGLDYYNDKEEGMKYIGIDKRILELPQLVLVEEETKIDEDLSIFSNVTGHKLCFRSNLSLKKKTGDIYIQDNFDHEQYVVINYGDKKILLSGCAHNGIFNILERFRVIYKKDPDVVISGFHLAQKNEYTYDDKNMIRELAMRLKKSNTMFYTGHCTGESAFHIMKEIMGDKLAYMHCGEMITL